MLGLTKWQKFPQFALLQLNKQLDKKNNHIKFLLLACKLIVAFPLFNLIFICLS